MTMTISIDDDLKREFSEVCHEIGLPPSTAIGIFARAVVRERAIPFRLSATSEQKQEEKAYEIAITEGIRRGLEDMAAGRVLSREESHHQRVQTKG